MDVHVLDLIKHLGDGRVLDDLHSRLVEVVAAVKNCHRKGKVTLTIEVKPTDDLEMQRIEIKGDVTYKLPLPNRGSEFYYVGDHLDLHRRDPRQRQIPENVIDARVDVDGKSRAAGER